MYIDILANIGELSLSFTIYHERFRYSICRIMGKTKDISYM